MKIMPVFIGVLLTLAAGIESAAAQNLPPGAVDFEKRCYSCHNINGGDKKGPDLKGLLDRRSKEWLREFIQAPAAMNRKGDADANALFKKFAPEIMPDQPLAPEQIDGILSLIESLTKKGETFIPTGAKLSRAIEAGDIDAGREAFTGKVALNNGGASCIACHNINGVGRFGGGTLGPDLTAVNTKYKDPELISILQNPNFPTMKSVFGAKPLTDEEIVKLFAYFQSAKFANPAAQTQPAVAPLNLWFPAIGFLGLVLSFVTLNRIWKNRLRGVREDLVRSSKK
ncbi:MAG: c-type cytochrome [Acidobacteria bacterium]|nr:c-type cytochrome [Acidobacteriota bacterium]